MSYTIPALDVLCFFIFIDIQWLFLFFPMKSQSLDSRPFLRIGQLIDPGTGDLITFEQSLVTFTNPANDQQSLQKMHLLIAITYVLKLHWRTRTSSGQNDFRRTVRFYPKRHVTYHGLRQKMSGKQPYDIDKIYWNMDFSWAVMPTCSFCWKCCQWLRAGVSKLFIWSAR